MTDDQCGGHPRLDGELRALLRTALDRVGPVVERMRGEPTENPTGCAACPVCAVLAALRGERTELAARLAEHAAGLLAALRATLEEEQAPPPGPPSGRKVQHIPVVRAGTPR